MSPGMLAHSRKTCLMRLHGQVFLLWDGLCGAAC